MGKQSVTEISHKSGKSASTVSKVLRNCPGVDPETREAVRSALGDESALDLIRGCTRGKICVILPDTPKFFWGRALSMLEGREVTVKIYSAIRLGGEDREVARCVSEAVAEDAAAVILAALPGEALCAEIARLAKERLFLQLCEYTPVVNSFYVGSDYGADGRALSKAVVSPKGARPLVGVLRQGDAASVVGRIEGFLEGLDGRADLIDIESPEMSPLYASHLARTMDRAGVRLDYLFCPFGMTAPVCDALYKLKGKMDTKYIGFELPSTAEKHWESGRIAAVAVQDPEMQMRSALLLAERYVKEGRFPDQKFHDMPSRYLFCP